MHINIFYLDSHKKKKKKSSGQKKIMKHLMSRNFNGKNSDYRTWILTHNTILDLLKLIRVLVSVLRRNPDDHNY
jgi:hypothetical protein